MVKVSLAATVLHLVHVHVPVRATSLWHEMHRGAPLVLPGASDPISTSVLHVAHLILPTLCLGIQDSHSLFFLFLIPTALSGMKRL